MSRLASSMSGAKMAGRAKQRLQRIPIHTIRPNHFSGVLIETPPALVGAALVAALGNHKGCLYCVASKCSTMNG